MKKKLYKTIAFFKIDQILCMKYIKKFNNFIYGVLYHTQEPVFNLYAVFMWVFSLEA